MSRRSLAALLSASLRSSSPNLRPLLARPISSSTPWLAGEGWLGKIKGALTGKKPAEGAMPTFTLVEFADQMDKARKMGSLKDFIMGRSFSEATITTAFEKQLAILRHLGSVDPSGENILNSQKQDAAKHCNCTIAEVESALAKFKWVKDAQKKIEKLKEEGKPLPTTLSELKKLTGSSTLEAAQSKSAKSKRVNKNDPCPCGSNKKYKRCCGTAEW